MMFLISGLKGYQRHILGAMGAGSHNLPFSAHFRIIYCFPHISAHFVIFCIFPHYNSDQKGLCTMMFLISGLKGYQRHILGAIGAGSHNLPFSAHFRIIYCFPHISAHFRTFCNFLHISA